MKPKEPKSAALKLPEYVKIPSYLNHAECDELIDRCKASQRFYRTQDSALAKRVSIAYLDPSNNKELARKLFDLGMKNNVWQLRLSGIRDPIRVQEYRRGDYNDTHSDFDYPTLDFSKLTIVISLLDRNSWGHGDLCIGNSKRSPRLNRGDAIIFPSFQPHFVSKISRGRRISLSAWISGPALR